MESLSNRERAALVIERAGYSAPPLAAPRIRIPWRALGGLMGWLVLALLFPLVVPLMVLLAVTHKALTKRTNKY